MEKKMLYFGFMLIRVVKNSGLWTHFVREERACKPVLYSIGFWGRFVYCWIVFRNVKIFAHYSPIHVALKSSFDFENIIDITFLYFCFISVLWLMWYNFPNEVILCDIRKDWAWKNILRIIRFRRAEFLHHKLKVHKLSFQTKGKKNHFCPYANYLRYTNTSQWKTYDQESIFLSKILDKHKNYHHGCYGEDKGRKAYNHLSG